MAKEVENFIFELSREMNIEVNGLFGNELELIALIRNCQFLYDKSRPDFKDNIMKEAAWQAIAKVMHAPASDCKYRWRSLRDQYNKLKKDSQEKCISWDLYDDMKFIDPYIIPRRGIFKKDKEDEDELVYKEEWLEDTEQYNIDTKGKLCKLIDCVKAHPILYNRDLFDYRDKKKKLLLWMAIAQDVGASASDCEARWKTLRERFGRERRQKKGDDVLKWKYYDDLAFLDKHVKERRVYRPSTAYRKILPKSELKSEEETGIPTIISSDVTLDNIEFIDATFEEEQEIEGSVPICVSPGSETNQSNFNVIENKTDHKRVEYRSSSSIHSQDEDDLFGQTIAAELRRIGSTRKKMKIKADMFKLLYEAESD